MNWFRRRGPETPAMPEPPTVANCYVALRNSADVLSDLASRLESLSEPGEWVEITIGPEGNRAVMIFSCRGDEEENSFYVEIRRAAVPADTEERA